MRKFLQKWALGALLMLMPLAVTASVLPAPFIEGMQISAPVGQDFVQSYAFDPCDGASTNCYTTEYHTGALVGQASSVYPSAPNFLGLLIDWCGSDTLCVSFHGNLESEGTWALSFSSAYETRYYLGGDEYGGAFVHTERRYLAHSFVLQATAPVPLPPSVFGLALGLIAMTGIGWGRRFSRP